MVSRKISYALPYLPCRISFPGDHCWPRHINRESKSGSLPELRGMLALTPDPRWKKGPVLCSHSNSLKLCGLDACLLSLYDCQGLKFCSEKTAVQKSSERTMSEQFPTIQPVEAPSLKHWEYFLNELQPMESPIWSRLLVTEENPTETVNPWQIGLEIGQESREGRKRVWTTEKAEKALENRKKIICNRSKSEI